MKKVIYSLLLFSFIGSAIADSTVIPEDEFLNEDTSDHIFVESISIQLSQSASLKSFCQKVSDSMKSTITAITNSLEDAQFIEPEGISAATKQRNGMVTTYRIHGDFDWGIQSKQISGRCTFYLPKNSR